MNLARMASQKVQGVLRSAVAGPEASTPVGQRSVLSELLDEFSVLVSGALSRPNSGMKV